MMLGNLIETPIYNLPVAVSQMILIYSSLKRIEKYLWCEEKKEGKILN